MPPDPLDLVLAGYAGFNAGERVPQLDFWHEDAAYEAAREDPDMWVRFARHGAGSGMPMEMQLAHVWTFRDDRAARVVEYFDRAEALRAFEAGA
jgi:ketosteroid isomerase-like protein